MSVLAFDNFNYANGTDLQTTGNWHAASNLAGLLAENNQVQLSTTTTDCSEYYTAVAFGADQWSLWRIATMNNNSCVVEIRTRQAATPTDTCYGAEVQGPFGTAGTMDIRKKVAGIVTVLASISATAQKNDLWWLDTVGTINKLYQNSTLILTAPTDSAVTSGQPAGGIEANGQTLTDCVIDTFRAGDHTRPPDLLTLAAGG